MDVKKFIQHCLVDRDLSLRDLAKILNTTVQNLSNKLQRNDMRISDLEKMLNAMNYDLEIKAKDKTEQ